MKHTLLLILFFFISLASFAQSDNLCPLSGVPNVPVNACGPTSYSIPTAWTWEDTTNVTQGTTCATASFNKGDGWFKFTAISTSTTIIGTVNTNRNLALLIYEGTCGSSTMLEVGGATCMNLTGNNGTETINLTTVVGNTYYIRLIKYNNASTLGGTISVLSPVANDDCSDAISITPSPVAINPVCTQTCGNTYYATGSSPTPACGGSDDADVWFIFTATQAQHIIEVGSSFAFNAVVEVLSGSCGSLSSRGCADAGGVGIVENLSLSNFVPGNDYYIRIYDKGAVPPGSYQFYVCVKSPFLPTCPGSLGGGVSNVSLPYSASGLTTVGSGDEFTSVSTLTCGSSTYLSGPDNVYIFTPTATGNISVTLTSGSNNVGIMLYDGCPFIGSGSSCVAYSQSNAGNQFFCANVVSGTKYYLIVDRNNAAGFNNFTLNITAPASGNNGATCATAVPISGFPYSIANQTTQCKGDDYNNSDPGSCATVYESGEDMVFSYNASGATCLQITLSNTVNQAGLSVYQGCPSSGSSNCLGSMNGNNSSQNFTLPAAGTYYIVVDSWDPPSNITFDLDITTSPGASPNDYPCSATTLPVNGSSVAGDNRCTNALLEPAKPSCWTGGTLNTVWYKVTPTGTTLNIRTTLGSLTNTQIGLYKGTPATSPCGVGSLAIFAASACNLDETSCDGGVTLNSQLTVTGLTAGTTYYVCVDGEQNLTGTFSITAIDATSGLPYISGQDCGAALPVCQSNFVSNPGLSGIGNYCDNNATNCTGESNSVWYTITIASSGNLMFDIIPNDWPGSGTSSSDYDFAIWQTNGLSCLDLTNTTPTRCNNNTLGVTGLNTGGNAPGLYPGFNNAYENPIAVTAGQTYKLMINNVSGSNSGFTLNFTGLPDPVSYPSAPATLTWSGVTNSSWAVAANWGACSLPTCGINVVCPNAPSNQPVITSNQTVNSVTIQAGATLTINANVTLSVCGNFTNSGNLVTGAGSIIKFVGNGAQAILAGNYTGGNAFANLTVQKPLGTTLTLQANIDIKENDSLLTGVFNPNGKIIKIKKNFYNDNGTSTHTSPATGSTYEFNGSAAQTFTNNGSEIDLNNVTMNQSPATSLTLNTGAFNNLNVGANGTLTLTAGKIITGAREVYVKNKVVGSCTVGNTTSYVEGFLRRNLNTNATGIYEFPVGHSAKGYQRASVNFTAATQIPNLLATFTPWGAVPVGPVSSECNTANYSLSPALNNGYWTIDASSNANTGTYSMTLWNLNYTNAANGWTVMKRTPSGGGPWVLNGTCVMANNINQVVRTSMSGFSDFATAQSSSPLPIELIRFSAETKPSGILTSWETASEINNNYFDLERSKDGLNFERIATITGSGTTTENHQYSFTDTDPGIGIIYYRLKQVDFDGGFGYSNIVAVKVNLSLYEINIFPNPANATINFEFELSRNSIVNYQVSDILGKILINETKEINRGNINSQLNIKNLPEGVYNLKVVENDAIFKGKFVKLDE